MTQFSVAGFLSMALLVSACTGGAGASRADSTVDSAGNPPLSFGVSHPTGPTVSTRAVSPQAPAEGRGKGRSLVPFGGGTSEVGYNDGTLTVEAGEPGSVALVQSPGQGPVGRPVRCSWHKIGASGPGVDWVWDTEPTVPEEGEAFVLACVHTDDGSNLTGYPRVVLYDPVDPMPGGAIGVEEVAKFAIDSITFENPAPVLSPPGEQIVGVETWLGVSSRLVYQQASAQAGNTWATVLPVLRDAVWTLGDLATVRCATDIDTTWHPASSASQSTTCSYVFESDSGPDPLRGRVDLSWTIYERTDRHPNTWKVWGVVTRSSVVNIVVGELQSVIR